MSNEGANVRREMMEKCMTCSLCNNFLTDAVTMDECIHTFCKECILNKLLDEESECCPICEVELGCLSGQRREPNIQDLKAKMCTSKRRKMNTPEYVPSVSTPQVPAQFTTAFNSSEDESMIHPAIASLIDEYGCDPFTYASSDESTARARIEMYQCMLNLGELINIMYYKGVDLEALYASIYSENEKVKAELTATQENLRRSELERKAANSALSDAEHRLKAKEAEVYELHEKYDNLADEAKKMNQSVSKQSSI